MVAARATGDTGGDAYHVFPNVNSLLPMLQSLITHEKTEKLEAATSEASTHALANLDLAIKRYKPDSFS